MIVIRCSRYECQMFKTVAEAAAYLKAPEALIISTMLGTGWFREYQIYTIYQGE